jgi:cysteinyl-tRNA synthetase
MKIYNTLTKKKEPLEPREPGEISMYVCGLTVYNYMHIGNARTFINFDMIRRYLDYRGFKVVFVRNITDVDDKIINRAAEEKTTPQEIAQKYERAFKEDTADLGIEDPTIEPRATETIPEMIALVAELIQNDLAYEADGNVWFRVRRFPAYGKLSGRTVDEMRTGERIEPEPGKDDPLDFALWKRSKPGEPSWDSPWGAGRPGWHLECSAMSLKFLGEGFDIHGGAHDLIFPHHENEIAQSEGGTGGPFARYWVHGGLLNLDKEKMSKSLGNVLLLRDLLKQWDADTLRMLMLSAHYRNPLDFTKEGLEQARSFVVRLITALENLDFALTVDSPRDEVKTKILNRLVGTTRAEFVEAMDDDFNTPAGLAAISGFVREANRLIEGEETIPDTPALEAAKSLIEELTQRAFGLKLDAEHLVSGGEKPRPGLEEISSLLAKREAARAAKDWAEADRVRQELADIGVEIEDTPRGPRWKYTGT